MQPTADDVLRFWFVETPSDAWWGGDAAFDDVVRRRFKALLEAAGAGELFTWRTTAEGRLAEVLVLDQFARNIHRGTERAFAYDGMALALAQEAVARGAHLELEPPRRTFLLMPYMHSESRAVHAVAESLFRECTPATNHAFELRHKAIVDRFGRYPHRNEALGRPSTPEELAFLEGPDSRF